MEQWKFSVLTGIILIILAVIFGMLRNDINIWIILIVILGIVDIISGFIRKNR